MNATKTVFQTVAAELSAAFETATRSNGETFKRLSDNAPTWIAGAGIIRAAHESVDGADPRLPSDWIYNLASAAADMVADCSDVETAREAVADFADGETDVYTARLFAWVSDNLRNVELCDSAAADCGLTIEPRHIDGGEFSGAVVRWMQGGQYAGAERVAHCIIDAIETEAANRK